MILFHDVDGCLNHPSGAPIGFTPASLTAPHSHSLVELGQLLDRSPVQQMVLNTGRSWEATAYLAETIDSEKMRYVLVEHGCELWDRVTQKPVDLVEFCQHRNMRQIETAIASVQRVKNLMAWFKTDGGQQLAKAVGWRNRFEYLADKTSNLTIAVPNTVDGAHLMQTLQEIIGHHPEFGAENFIYHHSRTDGFIDVMGNMDKGLGVELALEFLGAEHQQSVAVGNGLNDLPMLEAVALPICPASSEPEVRGLCAARGVDSHADYIDTTKVWLRQNT